MTRPWEDTHRPEMHRGFDNGPFNADDVPIGDIGGYFAATEVENALQELGRGPGKHVHAIGEQMWGSGSQTVFYLAQESDPFTVAAYVNGVRTDVTHDAMNDRITFATAPAAGALIRIDYLALVT